MKYKLIAAGLLLYSTVSVGANESCLMVTDAQVNKIAEAIEFAGVLIAASNISGRRFNTDGYGEGITTVESNIEHIKGIK